MRPFPNFPNSPNLAYPPPSGSNIICSLLVPHDASTAPNIRHLCDVTHYRQPTISVQSPMLMLNMFDLFNPHQRMLPTFTPNSVDNWHMSISFLTLRSCYYVQRKHWLHHWMDWWIQIFDVSYGTGFTYNRKPVSGKESTHPN